MNKNDIPESKLEKALNIFIWMSWCVGFSAALVGAENFSFHYDYMGNVFMSIGIVAFLIGLIIFMIKVCISSYLIELGFKENCKRGLHFGKTSKIESDRYAKEYGKCFYCKEVFALKQYRIEFNEAEFILEASNMVEAIRKLQDQQRGASMALGAIFRVTDLSRIGSRISTFVVKEYGALDIKK